MDFQDAPTIRLSRNLREKNQQFLEAVVQASDLSVQLMKEALKAEGYSDTDIENLISF